MAHSSEACIRGCHAPPMTTTLTITEQHRAQSKLKPLLQAMSCFSFPFPFRDRSQLMFQAPNELLQRVWISMISQYTPKLVRQVRNPTAPHLGAFHTCSTTHT